MTGTSLGALSRTRHVKRHRGPIAAGAGSNAIKTIEKKPIGVGSRSAPIVTPRRRRFRYLSQGVTAVASRGFVQRRFTFTLGRFTGVKGPGLIILIPVVQQMVRVDLRVVMQEVPPQEVISRDNVSVKVNAVLYFRIIDPERAIIKVGNYMAATSQLAQTTLRSVFGKHELDEMLAERDRLIADIQESS